MRSPAHALVGGPHALLLVALAVQACVGDIGGGGSSDPERVPTPDERRPEDGPAFELNRDTPRLLPLEARVARVARVLGVEPDDRALDPLREAAISLGDYDHSQNVLPDDRWTATRMAVWARLLVPICDDARIAARYPTDAELGELLAAAWGRPVSAEERAPFAEELAGLPEADQRRAACLTALGAAEAVLQ